MKNQQLYEDLLKNQVNDLLKGQAKSGEYLNLTPYSNHKERFAGYIREETNASQTANKR
jgi:hypothetical protein